MSDFNSGSTSQQSLIYDNSAFLHYFCSILSVLALALLTLIIIDLWKKIKHQSYKAIEQKQVFKQKVINTKAINRKQFVNGLKWKICGLLICLAFIWLFLWVSEDNRQLSGFDPYEILNLDTGATPTQIKKAYRKLALEMHPDRKKDDSASSRFILISKAYKCLTDAKTRENCEKFGNPDGEIYKKIGIGLPSFMLKSHYEKYVAFILLTILLIVIPCMFFKWASKVKELRSISEQIFQSNEVAYLLMTPKVNMMDYCLILGCMTELSDLFTQKSILSPEEEKKFIDLILAKSNLNNDQLQKLTPSKLFQIHFVYQYMSNLNSSIELARRIPQLCKSIIKFSSLFAKRSNQGFLLSEDSDLIINWYGLAPCRQAIAFSRAMMNRSEKHSFDQQQLSLLQKEDQLNSLPSLEIETKIRCGGNQVTQAAIGDVLTIEIDVFKKNNTCGMVTNRNFPLLIEEEFFLTVSNNSNLISSSFIKFSQSQKVKHCFELKRFPAGLFKINVSIYSLSYQNLDLTQIKEVYIFQKLKKKPVVFHQQDLRIEKIKKNFFESLIDLKIDQESDLQLSQSEQEKEESEQKPLKKKKKRLVKENIDPFSDAGQTNTGSES